MGTCFGENTPTDSENAPWIKLVTIGDYCVGKTCLLIRYTNHTYPHEYIPTIFDQYMQKVDVDGSSVHVDLFDTAGGEDYPRLRPLCYPGTNVFLLCYSPDLRTSLTNLNNEWKTELMQHCPDVPILVVCNKSDLRFDSKSDTKETKGTVDLTTFDEGKKMAEDVGAVNYMECSALTGVGVEEVFQEAIRIGLEHKRKQPNKRLRSCQVT